MRLYSYVVRYDSGFAPNPFYDWCTLATCKPRIRQSAQVGDWIIGTGSNNQQVQRGGHLVYAMQVSQVMTFNDYDADARFQSKKPYRRGSRKQSCGDNIYYRDADNKRWLQRDSFHSNADGTRRDDHVERDTGVNRVLASDQYVYFGGTGPRVPKSLTAADGRSLCKNGIGYYVFDEPQFIGKVETWVAALSGAGYQGPPFEWISLRD